MHDKEKGERIEPSKEGGRHVRTQHLLPHHQESPEGPAGISMGYPEVGTEMTGPGGPLPRSSGQSFPAPYVAFPRAGVHLTEELGATVLWRTGVSCSFHLNGPQGSLFSLQL